MASKITSVPTEPFQPRRGIRGGHAQTIAGNFLRRANHLPAPEERLFSVDTDVQLLCHCHWQADPRRAITLVIVHGLEGSSDSQYVIGTANKAWALGMNVVRMNIRNCGGTEQLSATLYHSGLSADVQAVVNALIADEKVERVALAGYSMGGNLVLKALGEWSFGVPSQIVAAVAVSPACDLSASADLLHSRQNRIYEWRFLLALRSSLKRKARHYPGRINPFVKGAYRSIRDFDDLITAPHFGFAGAEDYYTRASSGRVLDRITVPTLVIYSNDDPFIVMLPETKAKLRSNQNITFVETDHGGHCAFLADPNGYDGRWAERQIVSFVARASAPRQ